MHFFFPFEFGKRKETQNSDKSHFVNIIYKLMSLSLSIGDKFQHPEARYITLLSKYLAGPHGMIFSSLQWQQMDIEYTFWQMLHLCTSPKVVYVSCLCQFASILHHPRMVVGMLEGAVLN